MAYKYNPSNVSVTIDGFKMNGQGFIEDADHITIDPPKDQADIVQDVDGETFARVYKNGAIGEVKFTLMQGSPAHKKMSLLYMGQQKIPSIVLVISFKDDDYEVVVKDCVIKESASSSWGSKINNREWTIKGVMKDLQLPVSVSAI